MKTKKNVEEIVRGIIPNLSSLLEAQDNILEAVYNLRGQQDRTSDIYMIHMSLLLQAKHLNKVIVSDLDRLDKI